MKQLIRMLVAALALGCSDSTAPAVDGDLEIFRAKWESFGIQSYDYDLTTWNEWFTPATWRVSVRNGVVTDAVDAAGNHDAQVGKAVAQLFDIADDMTATARDEAADVQLKFDQSLGYVRLASIDVARWADDAYGYSAANLAIR